MYLVLLMGCMILATLLVFNKRLKVNVLMGLMLLCIAAHMSMYGFRVVLVPVYLLVIGSIGTTVFMKKSASLSILKRVSFAFGLLICMGVLYIFPNFNLPTPEGPYAIGSIALQLEDPSRDELYTAEGDDQRTLMVEVWYPAEKSSDSVRSSYPSEVAGALNSVLNVPDWLFGYFSKIETHHFENALVQASDEPYPLIVYSPGNQSTRFQNMAVIEALVSSGYVVVGIDHPYTSNDVVYLDGSVALRASGYLDVPDDHLYETEVAIRADDVQFVLEALKTYAFSEQIQSIIRQVDFDRIGMFGHSYGGATITEVMSRDQGIKAGISYDGGLWGGAVESGLEQPFLYLSASKTLDYMTDPSPKASATRAFVTAVYANLKEMQLKSGDAFYFVLLDDYNHYSFTDISLISPIFQSGDDPLASTIEYTQTFFDYHLKDSGGLQIGDLVAQKSDAQLILDLDAFEYEK